MSTATQRQLDKIRSEEDALVKALAEGELVSGVNTEGNPEDHRHPKQSTEENLLEPSGSDPGVTAGQDTVTDESAQDLAYWKKRALDSEFRFGKYKSSTDHTIFTLRKELKETQEDNLRIGREIVELRKTAKAKEPPVFTEETVAILGEDTVSAIQSVIDRTNSRVDKAEAELEAQRAKSIQDKIASNAKETYESFVSSLETLVPDCRLLNNDNGFLDWLDQPDFTGVPRLTRLQSAQKVGDVERVASFFIEYKGIRDAASATKDSIESRIGPVQKGSSEKVTKETSDVITTSFIKNFEADVSRGRYRGRESERDAIDRKIEAAYLAGRIVDK